MKKRTKLPLVSVIIPTYNRGWVVKEAIDSVLDQDFSDYELIVVDDGSNDNTREILEAYGKAITVLQQSNRGVSAARNRGIAEAAGRLIAFLDSDDLWLPRKLTAQVKFFEENADAVINQTQEIWIRNGLRVNPKKRHHKFSGMIFERSLALCLVSPSAVMIKKSLFDAVGVLMNSCRPVKITICGCGSAAGIRFTLWILLWSSSAAVMMISFQKLPVWINTEFSL